MKNRSHSLFFVALALSVSMAPTQAGILYWDGTSTNADANGGNGTWDTIVTNLNWDSLATGGTDNAWPAVTTLDDDAVFGGIAGTVDVAAGGVTANSLTFTTANYILQGGKITFDGTTPTITNAVATTINSEIAGTAGFTKTGAGALTLGGVSTYTGTTTLNAGTLFLSGGSNRLATTGIVSFSGSSTLNLGGNSQTLANLSVSAGGSVSNIITNGSLTLSGASDLVLTPTASPTTAGAYSLDASGLSSLTISKSGNSLSVGGNSAATGAQTGTFRLSSTSNTITVLNLNVGTNGGTGSIVNSGTLSLGTTNFINATNVQVGSTRSNANLSFQTGLTGASLTLRGVTGGTSRVNRFIVGFNSAGGTGGNTQIADFSLGTIDARITDLFVSQGSSAGTNIPSVNGTFTMANGTLDATTIAISDNITGGGNTANTGTFNQNAGTVTVGTLTLGRRTGAAAAPRLLPSYNLGTSTTTGILQAATIQAGGGAVATNSLRNINFNNGTIQNFDSATNLVINGSATAAENRINIVLAATGTHTFLADASRTITLGTFTNVSGTNGTLTKAGAGTLILAGANSYTGATDVRNGTLQLNSALNAATALNLGNGSDSGKVVLGNAAALAQTVAGLTTTGSGIANSIVGSGATNSTLTVNLTSGSNTFGGVLGGGGTNENNLAIVKTGAGTLSLSGANTYIGGTAVDVGGLAFLNSSAKPASGTTAVAAGATLGLGVSSSVGFFNSTDVNSLFSGTLSNVANDAGSWVGIDTTAGDFDHAVSIPSSTRGLRKLGGNTLILSTSSAHSGATAVDAGTLRIANASALGTTAAGTTVVSGATLAVSGGLSVGAEALNLNGTGIGNVGAIQSISGVNSMSGAVTLAGATRIGVEADTLEMSGAFTGTQALNVVGAGKLILSGGGTFGQLIVGNSAVPAGGHLEWKAGTGTAAGTYFGVGDNVSAAFTMSGGSLTVSPTASLFVGSFSSSAVTGTLNVTDGTFTMGNSLAIYVGGGGFNGNVSGNGALNVSNGTFSTGTTTGTFRMGANAAAQTGNGEINLSGTGIVETARSITKGAQGTATVNFDGGTYRLRADQATMFGTGVVTNVKAGGATIDTNTFNGTIGTVFAAGSPSGGLTKQGAGTLTLTNTNSYTGVTTISAGTISIASLGDGGVSGNLGAAPVAASNLVFGGGTLQISAAGTASSNRGFTINAASSATFNVSNAAGAITLTGSVPTTTGVLFKTGVGSLTLNPGAVSQSLGALSANGGELILKSGTYATTAKDASQPAYNIGAGARGGTLTIDGATLNVGGGNNLKIAATTSGNLSILSGTVTSSDMVIGHNGAGVATQGGGSVTVANLYHQDSGTGSSYTLTGGDLTARRIFNNTAGANDFTLNLNGGTLKSASSTTNLIDNDGLTGLDITVRLGAGNTVIDTTSSNATIVRPMGDMPAVAGTFTKAGANILTLTGASTYTGGTTLDAGTLLANNSTGSATGTGTVTVDGGTLGGTGSISGAVTINTTGVLSPGASVESLATGALTLNGGSSFLYELNTTATIADLLDVNGNLDINGTVTLNLADLGSNSSLALGTKFVMISYSGSWTPGDVFSGYADDSMFAMFGNEWEINYDDVTLGSSNGGAFSNAVTLTVIPEPGAALLGGLGLLALLRRRR